MNNQNDDFGQSHWISFSDIMTGLMVIFMFIAISYMIQVKSKEQQIKQVLELYENTRDSIRLDLSLLINGELGQWKDYVEFDTSNLSIKFIGSDIQFRPDSDRVRSRFKNVLDDFIPKYVSVISQEKYKDKIAEVRIEGHANRINVNSTSHTEYMKGVKWSQRRAKRVLEYFTNSRSYRKLTPTVKNRLQFWMVANGYGYGRTLDNKGQYTEFSDKPICESCSRRVEFRIITVSDQVIADIVSKLKE